MSRIRVLSPSAAKIGAEFSKDDFFCGALFDGTLRCGFMFSNVFHLFVPSAAVHTKRFHATRRWEIVKTGFDDAQQGASLGFLQLEYDQRGWFFRIVD